MSSLYGRPTAAELVAVVADFLDNDVRSSTEGQVNFHARVAANVLRTVERELRDESTGEVSDALGGLGSVEGFVSAYEAAGGEPIDRDALRWWLTLATLRWGVICRFQAERHLSGVSPSVELAAIGRRVSETEWDVLDLLTGGGPR